MSNLRSRSLAFGALCAAVIITSPAVVAADPTTAGGSGVGIDSGTSESVELDLRTQGDGAGQLDETAVTADEGSLSGSLGSTGSSSSSGPAEVDDTVDSPESVTATGGIDFARRSIDLADDTAEFTVSRPVDTTALHKLLEFGRGAYFLAPMDVSATTDVAEQGVTMSFSFDSPITDDEFYSIMFFDEEAEAWSPVETALSPDRTTLSTTVHHLSTWTAVRSGLDSAMSAIDVGLDAAGAGLKAVGDGFSTVLSNAPEFIYRTGSSIAGNYADTPTCTGDTPDWLLTGKNAIDTAPSDFAAPIKFCAGSVPGSPDRLEIKAVVNRTTPFLLEMPGAHVEVLGDLTINGPVGTALDLALDPVAGVYKAWSNAGSRLLVPGQVSTIRVNKAAFDAGGDSFRIHAVALNPIAGAAFRGLSLALGEVSGNLSNMLAIIAVGQCLGNLTSAAYQSSGQVLNMVGPTVNCVVSQASAEIRKLETAGVVTAQTASTLLRRLTVILVVAQVSQTVAEMIMDYASGARTRTIQMYAKNAYTDPVTVDPAAELTGPGVTISNSHAVGSESQFGRSTDMFGGRSSWVLTTGLMESIDSPPSTHASTNLGGPGNTELSQLSGGNTYDAATYRFMVTPSGSKLHVEYAFATEEFPDYVGTGYNDVMAIYVNGQNCAVIPETGEPISVNTVNHVTNSQWFADNRSGQVSHNLAFNGVTKDLVCTADVTPDQQVEVLIAVADTGDGILDSAVALVDGGVYSTN